MTYKEIVDNLKEIVFKHKMLVDFGYGDLSDIKVKSQNDTDKGSEGADYPYAFLNPTSHSRVGSSMVYRFNLIVMEMSTDETSSVLDAQSRCQQYIDDIIAKWHFDYLSRKTDINLNYTTTPFKQRFQDTVAGMTAQIEITVSKPIDNCLAPFEIDGTLFVHARTSYDYHILPETGTITTTAGNVLMFDEIIQTDGGWLGSPVLYRYYPQSTGSYRFEVNFQMTLTQPQGSEIIGDPPRGVFYKNGVYTYFDADITVGWPTSFVSESTVYNVRQVFTDVVTDIAGTYFEYIRSNSNGALVTTDWYELEGSEIKVYKLD